MEGEEEECGGEKGGDKRGGEEKEPLLVLRAGLLRLLESAKNINISF